MDSVQCRHVISRIAQEVAPGLTQGQVDYYFQYKWKDYMSNSVVEIAAQLKILEKTVLELGEEAWETSLDRRDPLRKGELAYSYKKKMDWEW